MKPLVIKLGGNILKKEAALNNLFTTLANYLNIYNNRFIMIVHGGGYIVDDLMKKLSLSIIKKNGLRITPHDQIDIVVGALAGIANKKLLAWAKKHKINAIGLCLSDGNIVNSLQIDKKLGNVGHVFPGNSSLLNILFDSQYIPIISSIGIDDNGNLLNINADEAAAALALTTDANLVLLSDVNGIKDNKGNFIKEIKKHEAERLISNNVIQHGMVIKVRAALKVAFILNRPVNIASWEYIDQLNALFNGYSIGTRVHN
ncbi:acetylglutamate kinase [Candidatus Pantoea edessiphila]|uniref:Acetylglutamate kinase n=1 Tax=Candidatus Pantoea edessiphila TaxID=2044610 RepID=A0A2P5SZ67_9GAMM|nr:acetylglutamate kinase [Candidatus Pantoea edessiphila]